MKKLLITLGITVLSISSMSAQAGVPWYGSDAPTYARTYSPLHMKAHPHQQVRSIVVTNGLSDLIAPLPGEMNHYVGAELTGAITLRDGRKLEIHWTCREDRGAGREQLSCIPMDADLWNAMNRGTIAVFTDANESTETLPEREFIRFPGTAAFHAIDASRARGNNAPVLLGSDVSGPEGDTIFRLKVLPNILD